MVKHAKLNAATTKPTASSRPADSHASRTSMCPVRGEMVILKSYNRANLTTPSLRTPIRRAQNAQDERL
eukprot:2123254-Prymnesium_polylepis.1